MSISSLVHRLFIALVLSGSVTACVSGGQQAGPTGYVNDHDLLVDPNTKTMALFSFIGDDRGRFFLINVQLTKGSNDIQFSPSLVTARLGGGKVISAKGVKCEEAMGNLEYYRLLSSLAEPITIRKDGCFTLFFDCPIESSTKEQVILEMNGSVKANGSKIAFRPVHFEKNPEKRRGGLGLFQ